MIEIGKSIIFIGLCLTLVGFVVVLLGKLNYSGRLPGDIFVKKGNFTFYFPLVTCIILSLILNLIMFFIRRK